MYVISITERKVGERKGGTDAVICCERGLMDLLRVYDITKLYVNNGLVSATPFKTKSACAKAINITRGTLTLYLDSDKVLHNKWIISSRELSKELLSKYLITSEV